MKIIAGSHKNKNIITPKHEFRPTQGVVREALFNILDVQGKSVLDLFAGSGAVGLEALSRGASLAYFVDSETDATKAIAESLGQGNFEGGVVLRRKAEDFLRQTDKQFDVVFADPPYYQNLYTEIIQTVRTRNIVKPGGMFVIEINRGDEEMQRIEPSIILEERKYGKTLLLFIDIGQSSEEEE